MDALNKVLDRTIYLARVGSQAYGTNLESSDSDFKGVCVETPAYYFGFLRKFEQLERSDPYDLVVMSLRKFCSLAAECNPNIIELLFVDDRDVAFINRYGEELLSHRREFLSRKSRHTFAGYAHAQLRRIKTHRNWLLNPPKAPPTRTEFGLSEVSKVSKSELGAFDALSEVDLPKDVLALFLREKQYQAAKTTYDQYANWKATRNPARAELEAKFGYDPKHAMHLVRLLRMCREILSSGEVIVRRPDADELKAIRQGAWSYDQVLEHADALELECAKLYETSALPHAPDRVGLDRIVVELTERYLTSFP